MTGIQIGPRQFELPPNMLVNARDGPNSEGAQEFLLLQQDLQHTTEIGFIQYRSQASIFAAGLQRVMNERHQFRACLEILACGPADLGVFRRELLFENGYCAKGQQPDHRANLQAFGPPVRQAKHIVKEAVFLIPHSEFLTRPNHTRGDHEKVLDEFHRETDIGRIGHRQLHADLDHVLTEEGHPGGAIGLFQIPAGRQRRGPVEDPDIVQPQ
ncbi:MAG: hypothetical protein H6Q86_5925, partial [candidate division NC10 bacterium]|nr:hypothetical protein [candidate division NC10 bacterium]